jgi:hypothetical protein
MIGVTHPGPDGLVKRPWTNWFAKHRLGLYDRWLKEIPARNGDDKVFQEVWPETRDEFQQNRERNQIQWCGWYSRHNGETEYVGDHIAGRLGEAVPASILLALLVVLMGAFFKHLSSVARSAS